MLARRAAAAARGLSADARQGAGLGRPPRRGEHPLRPRRARDGAAARARLGRDHDPLPRPGPLRPFALALSFVQLFGVLADAGLTTIVVRELAQKPGARRGGARLRARAALRARDRRRAAAALAALLLPYPPEVRVAVLIAGVPLVFGLLNSASSRSSSPTCARARIAIADVAGRAAALAAVVVVVGARPRLLRRRGRRGRGRAR